MPDKYFSKVAKKSPRFYYDLYKIKLKEVEESGSVIFLKSTLEGVG